MDDDCIGEKQQLLLLEEVGGCGGERADGVGKEEENKEIAAWSNLADCHGKMKAHGAAEEAE